MNNDNEAPAAVVIERIFEAPVELMWELWTRAEHVMAWYGPAGASIPVAKMDVRVGGTRLVCMEVTSPQGPMRMWFTGEYKEVINQRRLVYTESIADEHGNVSPAGDGDPGTTEVSIEFHELGSRTKMMLTHVGISGGSPGATGWAMALDKLASHARTEQSRL